MTWMFRTKDGFANADFVSIVKYTLPEVLINARVKWITYLKRCNLRTANKINFNVYVNICEASKYKRRTI